MSKPWRSFLALAIGGLLGWVAYPLIVGLAAAALGDIGENAGAAGDPHDGALAGALFTLLGLARGVYRRASHALEDRRSLDKPRSPPWVSGPLLEQVAVMSIALALLWLARDVVTIRGDWFMHAASYLAWCVVWGGAAACAALALAAAGALGGSGPERSRVPVLAGWVAAGSALALPAMREIPLATAAPFEAAVEASREEPGASLSKAPVLAMSFASGSRRPGGGGGGRGEGCADSFLRPGGSRRAAWRTGETLVRRRAGWRVDAEQLLVDAVVATCAAGPENPTPYFVKVVSRLLIRRNRVPDGEACTIDDEVPSPIDIEVGANSRLCWILIQGAACSKGDEMEAILRLKAAGTEFPEIADALQMSVSAVKMRMKRFMDGLPEEIRQQCR